MNDFSITAKDACKLAEILRACRNVERTFVQFDGLNVVVEGIARHIVAPDSAGFPETITPDCRLWVTAWVEHFIPLRQIKEVNVASDGTLHLVAE